jgi:hypothetical protein
MLVADGVQGVGHVFAQQLIIRAIDDAVAQCAMLSSCREVEAIQGVRPEVVAAITKATKNCLNDTQLSIGQRKKVQARLHHACNSH